MKNKLVNNTVTDAVKKTKKTLANAVYEVDEEKRIVRCYIISKGQKVYGIAKCGPHDEFDVERGKEIAAYRCEINQRLRDLENTNEVVDFLKDLVNEQEALIKLGKLKRANVSKHWVNFLRIACEERRMQLDNIKFCREQMRKLF